MVLGVSVGFSIGKVVKGLRRVLGSDGCSRILGFGFSRDFVRSVKFWVRLVEVFVLGLRRGNWESKMMSILQSFEKPRSSNNYNNNSYKI